MSLLNSPIIDVALGLTLVYIALSLILTSVQELIERFTKSRSKDLEQAISGLLDDPGGSVRSVLYAHPLIYGLFRGDYRPSRFSGDRRIGPAAGNLPSYIPREQFALTLHDLLKDDAAKLSGASARLRQAYRLVHTVAAGDVARIRRELESWYDGAMDRAAGWYKRRTQGIVFLLGLALALALNLNTFELGQTIATSKGLSPALERAATKLLEEKPAALVAPAVKDSATRSTSADPDDPAQQISAAEAQLGQLGFPIGWDDRAVRQLQSDLTQADLIILVLNVLKLLIGYAATAFAVTLGAPFWFDVLNKIMVVRSTVKPKEKSPDEASEDRQAPKKTLLVEPELVPDPGLLDQSKPGEAAPGQEDARDDCLCDVPPVPGEALTRDEDLPPADGGLGGAAR